MDPVTLPCHKAPRCLMTFQTKALIQSLIKFKFSCNRKIEKLLVTKALQPRKIASLFYLSEIFGLTLLLLKFSNVTNNKEPITKLDR